MKSREVVNLAAPDVSSVFSSDIHLSEERLRNFIWSKVTVLCLFEFVHYWKQYSRLFVVAAMDYGHYLFLFVLFIMVLIL